MTQHPLLNDVGNAPAVLHPLRESLVASFRKQCIDMNQKFENEKKRHPRIKNNQRHPTMGSGINKQRSINP